MTQLPANDKRMTGLANDNRTEQDQLIIDCELRETALTAWEANFIDSIRGKFDAGFFLSDKQLAVLNAIWAKVTVKMPHVTRS